MHKYIIIILMLSLPIILVAQEQKADSSQAVQDIVVKETYETGFIEEKFPIKLSTNFSDVVKIQERINWDTIDKEKQAGSSNTWQNFSFNLSSPEFANIQPPPVKVFRVQFKDLSSWKLDITTSDGTLFRTIAGEGNPPESIEWDGKGNNGDMLVPGHNYSYSFTPIDKAGNKRTFPGQTFSIPAVYLSQGDSVWVRIAYSKLFSYDGFGLLRDAEDYSKEIASLIRYHSKKGQVTIDCAHPNSKEFMKLLSDNLNQSENFLKCRSDAPPQKESFLTVLIE